MQLGDLLLIRYSMIEAYLMCPKKYKTLYIEGRGEKTDSSALHFGTAMHTALNAIFEGSDPYTVFSMYWNSVKDKHLEYDRFNWEYLKSAAEDRFLPNFIKFHQKHFETPKMEETLTAPILDKHTLQGTYDCAAVIDGKLTIVDYKTSSNKYNLSKIIRNPQLYIYSYLYQQKYGELPQQVMYKIFIKSDRSIQTLKYPLTQAKLDDMMSNIKMIIQDIVDRSNWYCNSSCYCITPKECFPDKE